MEDGRIHKTTRPVTRGVRGVRTNPPFREPPPKNTNPPPPHLKRSGSISDTVFQLYSTSPGNLLLFSKLGRFLRPLLSALRTCIQHSPIIQNRSYRLNLPKNFRCWRPVWNNSAILRQLKTLVSDEGVNMLHPNQY